MKSRMFPFFVWFAASSLAAIGARRASGGEVSYRQPIDCSIGAIIPSNLNGMTSTVRVDDFEATVTGSITKVVFWFAAFDFYYAQPRDPFSTIKAVHVSIYDWVGDGACGWGVGNLLSSSRFSLAELQVRYECPGPRWGVEGYRAEATLSVPCPQVSGQRYAIKIAGEVYDPWSYSAMGWLHTASISGDVGLTLDRYTGTPTCGPLQLDHAFELEIKVCSGEASWSNFGAGWPGTLGLPSFTASADPKVCTYVELTIGNSRGATTPAVLFRGFAALDVPSAYGGHLLVLPTSVFPFVLPAMGASLPMSLPCDASLCGAQVLFQVWQSDPGASKGVSFTRGLKLEIGS